MTVTILKILGFIAGLPAMISALYRRYLEARIRKLESSVAQKDATIASDRLEKARIQETEKAKDGVKQDAKTQTLSDIANYFNTPQ